MNSMILRTAARLLVSLILLFSIYLLFRGHNLPGGGFVGGLVAAIAFAVYAIAEDAASVRRALVVDPRKLAMAGVGVAIFAGLMPTLTGDPFLTGLWWKDILPLGTPLLFDVGVYLTVLGAVIAVFLPIEEED